MERKELLAYWKEYKEHVDSENSAMVSRIIRDFGPTMVHGERYSTATFEGFMDWLATKE